MLAGAPFFGGGRMVFDLADGGNLLLSPLQNHRLDVPRESRIHGNPHWMGENRPVLDASGISFW